ncbi:putative enzyme involved in biosynthesis of extracellular polysaccharides [Candidatus Nitrososphaera evergladensis SR1]|uniref:Putative enzyme involved in biosynthesis of extracellular polysaccharides n=1 Tax=Candidatus Nitrososphaera evergladensis SR1 TaxID=1459636 RepID=A0A075MMI3_9ARCH|nr:antibiotic biosynthesis monooxygenase [Candidatus Nitrososphaera evergladensis]AIF82676.1 putative enzyme involved in biosynthesis of extracellular polysaccharides [Candidatus Nitrososphaera evergladensis SR1]
MADQLVEKRALLEGQMFVAIADIELKKGKEDEFKKWFVQSNHILAGQDGFIARKLLKSPRGSHRILVIMESKEAFARMHTTPEHAKLHMEALAFMTRPPKISAYDSVS